MRLTRACSRHSSLHRAGRADLPGHLHPGAVAREERGGRDARAEPSCHPLVFVVHRLAPAFRGVCPSTTEAGRRLVPEITWESAVSLRELAVSWALADANAEAGGRMGAMGTTDLEPTEGQRPARPSRFRTWAPPADRPPSGPSPPGPPCRRPGRPVPSAGDSPPDAPVAPAAAPSGHEPAPRRAARRGGRRARGRPRGHRRDGRARRRQLGARSTGRWSRRSPPARATLDIQGILAKVQPSVVAIETSGSTPGGEFDGAGSGIVLTRRRARAHQRPRDRQHRRHHRRAPRRQRAPGDPRRAPRPTTTSP